MHFEPLELHGAWKIRPEKHFDSRGSFARTICVSEFRDHGLNGTFIQSSISYNRSRGTLRGIHFQWPPSHECKLVRCTKGSVLDLLVDLRPESPTYLRTTTVELDDKDDIAVYIPAGFGHGFLTLSDDVVVQYHMTDEYRPDLADGFRWSDPAFGISLPAPISVISERDASYPPFDASSYETRYRRVSRGES